MKFLFIITRADTIGGAQVHVRDLAKALNQDRHEVLVVTGVRGAYTTELHKWGINSISCEFLEKNINLVKDCQSFNFLKETIRNFKPDIVSTHSSKAGLLGRLACKIADTPCIFTAHGWAFTGGVPEPSRTLYQWVEKLAEPLADKIICVSENDRSIGVKVGMQADRLLTIHNGMPDIPNELRANPMASNPVRIVMVARFDRQKDHLTLLRAFQKIQGAQLDLVGNGPNIEVIKTMALKLGIADSVNFLGHRNDIAKVLAQAQIFTLISNWEGFPRTTLEAMRAGMPVVVSNVGGASEAVIDGITGYCVPHQDVDVLRDRLSKLVSDVDLRTKMGDQGRKRYEAEFTFERMFERNCKIYEQVLANRGKGK
ncbi:glycosyl transferase group 1 [Crinalium epipsammum PCC 9333]|uniref:Glycosyl transferase group 1 n=1 Tax=Crinalium epipsammum PCC 9333 TaxID=1173022 RepID=K9W3F2_9CYAN|nr:glycosyltransferase family 4 protein [Crinalium epipsammum]AFZ14324.1 glycosyl transferase group 1 [Crinalium epipsammum PCC 9333]